MTAAPVSMPARRRWSIAGLLFASGFINYLDRAILSVALPLIAVDLHLGPASKGVLLSAFFWSYALMQLPMGWFADRLNLRWLYAGAFAVWSLACGFTGFAGTLTILILLRIVLGVGESVYLPAGMKIVNLLFSSKDHGLATGIMNCGTRAGLALGAPLVAALVVRFNWKGTFILVGFTSLLWLFPWMLVFRLGNHTAGAAEPSLARFRFDRNLLGLCLAQICYSYYWYLLVTWLPDYLVESRHIPIERAGVLAMIPYLIFAMCEPLGGWISDRLVHAGWNETRTRKGVLTIAFLMSLLFLPAGMVSNNALAIGLMGGASLVGLATGNQLALLQRMAPTGTVGMWTGTFNFCGNLSGIAAPLATGILIARTGSYLPGFVVAVIVLLAGLPAYWWIVRDQPSSQQKSRNAV